MRCTVTQLARESVGLCPLSWFVREGIRVKKSGGSLRHAVTRKIRLSTEKATAETEKKHS